MAYKESEKITADKYTLGGYTFDFTERDTSVFVTCTGPNGEKATKGASIGQSKVVGWYVEANSTTADVYGILKVPSGEGSGYSYKGQTVNISDPGSVFHSFGETPESIGANTYGYAEITSSGGPVYGVSESNINNPEGIVQKLYSKYPFSGTQRGYNNIRKPIRCNSIADYYYAFIGGAFTDDGTYTNIEYSPSKSIVDTSICSVADIIFKGQAIPTGYTETTILLARFAIDVTEAGGGPDDTLDDPDDEWDEPEDYDPEEDPIEYGDPDYPDPEDPDYPDPIEYGDPDYPDPEDPDYPGDQDEDGIPDPYHPDYYPPTKTLYLTVTGALSGRHNDPLTDLFVKDGKYKPYIPTDKETIKSHGCGGDGGHGGGGGAGASTVIIHRFATSKANSKELKTIAQRHGYGSGGGKGGKGGSGCILIYY